VIFIITIIIIITSVFHPVIQFPEKRRRKGTFNVKDGQKR